MKRQKVDECVDEARELYKNTFDGKEPTVISRAPGRVNLIGEHTDYSKGFCMPMAIPLSTVCCLSRKTNGDLTKTSLISVQSPDKIISFEVGKNSDEPWATYIAGVAAQYGIDFPVEASFCSNVPLGGGLSSSAALDVSFAIALEQLIDPKKEWDAAKRALLCVEGDHTYVGVQCGIMDQFASSCAAKGYALLVDCLDETGTLISFDDPSICIVVTNSNIKHSHSTGEYGARVKECKQACKDLGVEFLRFCTDVSKVESIKDPIVKARARHVISENNRCLEAAEAAKTKNWEVFGKLMNDSHESLKADFEVTCPELDFLVSTSQKQNGVYGSRMTGGGFGGCIVTLIKKENAEALIQTLEKKYAEEFPSCNCTSYIFSSPEDGARIVESKIEGN